jgi:hypothetical protein
MDRTRIIEQMIALPARFSNEDVQAFKDAVNEREAIMWESGVEDFEIKHYWMWLKIGNAARNREKSRKQKVEISISAPDFGKR